MGRLDRAYIARPACVYFLHVFVHAILHGPNHTSNSCIEYFWQKLKMFVNFILVLYYMTSQDILLTLKVFTVLITRPEQCFRKTVNAWLLNAL